MSELTTTVTLRANSDYGQNGQFVARITGRHPKFTFAYDFLGRRAGKRGDVTEATIDDPGLYVERDVSRKRGKDDSFYVVAMLPTGLRKIPCTTDEMMGFARRIEEGESITVIGIEYAVSELRRMIQGGREHIESGNSEEIVNEACPVGAIASGTKIADRVSAREALLATLLGTSDPNGALREERARLVARIAEIDAQLADRSS